MAKQSHPTMSRALQKRENITGYLFMLPSLIFFIGFVVIPMIICIITSLTDANMHDQGMFGNFVGLSNFAKLTKDVDFLEALKNTFIIVVVSVPTVCAFSLWVSLQAQRAGALRLPLHFLLARSHWLRSGYCSVEVDV